MGYVVFHLIAFYIVHSLLATAKLKKIAKQEWPSIFKYYRLLYNLLSILWLTFIVKLCVYEWGLSEPILKSHWVLGLVLLGMGFLIVFGSLMQIDIKSFIGIRSDDENNPPILTQNGLYGLVRHPLYLGVIFSLIGLLALHFSQFTLSLVIITIVYILIGIELEEKKLTVEFGKDYVLYQQKIKKLIPFIY